MSNDADLIDSLDHWIQRAEKAETELAKEKWELISTAPKDGEHILVCFANPPYSKRWTFMQRPPTVAHWFEHPDKPGWYLSVNQSDSDRIHPTHWTSVPVPPL